MYRRLGGLHDPEYFGLKSLLKTGDLFGIQHIYGDLTRADGKDPLDFPAFLANPTEYEAVVTNALTGRPEYFGKDAMKQDDYRLIMASSAIPVACHPVELNGVPYFDGGLTDAIPVRRALERGCGKLVVILSKNRDYVKKPQIVAALDRRHNVYNANFQEVFALERAGKAFVLAPSEPLHVGTYSMKEKAEQELYDLGLRDFAAQKEKLQSFLST